MEGKEGGLFTRIKEGLKKAFTPLKTADLNPHEGKLRASGMPDADLQKRFPVPDAPPLHDDTIPEKPTDK